MEQFIGCDAQEVLSVRRRERKKGKPATVVVCPVKYIYHAAIW